MAHTLGAIQGVDEIVGENPTQLQTARNGDPLVTFPEKLKEHRQTHSPSIIHHQSTCGEHSPLSLEKPLLISRPGGKGEAGPGPRPPLCR